ncbi:transporter substrate-binding domain-containing protein [Pseudomonas aeruginosa]|nr:transporter substrate-binding domain-containing protein [Pseudomonas aeruginosa]
MGFDVDYCNDLAKALDVKAEIVETPFPDRIPALVSGRADVIVASTSDTLERAKTIGMSIPTRLRQGGTDPRGHRHRQLRGPQGPAGRRHRRIEALALEKDSKAWGDAKGSFRAYQSEADTAWRSARGTSSATVVSSTVAASWIKSGKLQGLKIAGDAPYDIDYVALGASATNTACSAYLNLFINQQVRAPADAELAQKSRRHGAGADHRAV